jgi:hypothetical protein
MCILNVKRRDERVTSSRQLPYCVVLWEARENRLLNSLARAQEKSDTIKH